MAWYWVGTDEAEHRVNFPIFKFSHDVSRAQRRAMAMFVVGMYLVAGVLHGMCDLDVTNAASTMVISMEGKSTGQADRASLADHHCHGCFSVSVPSPAVAAVTKTLAVEVVPLAEVARRGLPPGIDPPPPKHLT